MYRHTAESIKESSDRMFISSEEKTKFNNYENTMRRKDDSYNKEEVDNKVNQIKNMLYESVEGSYNSIDNTLDGYLKDVEIKGNTIQDPNNLTDIRSVGDRVEGQELYEIPVLSCGKNLFNGEFLDGKAIDFTTGNYYDNPNMSSIKNYISVKSNATYYFNVKPYAWVIQYDTNKKCIDAKQFWEKFTTDTNCRYIKIYIQTEHKHNTIQLEEGTVATPYEPYIEDKLTILSPVQLEKVGDVRDRIIEKDGVLGVEKNVITCRFNGSENFNPYSNQGQINTKAWRVDISGHVSSWQTGYGICNEYTFTIGNDVYSGDFPCVTTDTNSFIIRDYVSKYNTVTELKNGLALNNLVVKLPAITSQFIPLPHDQQVKLRTFANKTNISFGCEIEGTIKAQVPKSLGATVNTHTEQINNLNKELDRVKKLEESTVSTVTTESDFTTVEATSNGYFEDVKLEGKTLVNLSDINAFSISGAGTTIHTNIDKIKPNATYTRIVYITKNTLVGANERGLVGQLNDGERVILNKDIQIAQNFVGLLDCSKYTISDIIKEKLSSVRIFSINTGGVLEGYEIILEGDHTQNPPSYFEGLKSVGQSATTSDDGADEISVESVKGDGNLWDGTYEIGSISTSNGMDATNGTSRKRSFYIPICETKYYAKVLDYVNTDSQVFIHCYDKNKNPIKWNYGDYIMGVQNDTVTLTIPTGGRYLKFRTEDNRVLTPNSVLITKFDIIKGDTSHKSDKKRLLYYNEETQAWEKPILREWDIIEKHADGKYYFHQRSREVVFDGSESFSLQSDFVTQETTIGFSLGGISDGISEGGVAIGLSNRFTVKSQSELHNNDKEGFTQGYNRLYFRVSKSKLSTQDVAGFKQWLQANNVTVVYQLAQEKVYECTNIDLITYANETNYIVESGSISPKTTLKVHNNISNVVNLLQKKVSLLETNQIEYQILQNRILLNSKYTADRGEFRIDIINEPYSTRTLDDIDLDTFYLTKAVIDSGKENYDLELIESIIDFYTMIGKFSFEMSDYLFNLINNQINPPVIELPEEVSILPEI